MTRRPAVALLVAACVAAGWVHAAGPAAVDQTPTWASLTPAQKSALTPLQRDWASLELASKRKWLEVAGRFPKMPDAERQRVQERMGEWARMTPTERAQARLQFQETRQISAEDRQARWEAYKALPDDERKALAQRAKPAARAASAVEPKAVAADASPKRNIVPTGRATTPAKPVAPTVVQARPGATTSLMSAKTPPPGHQQPGMPKIAATEGFVNPTTLLPRRGPQGAAVSAAAASAPADNHP